MSVQIIQSESLVELSVAEQQFLSGGVQLFTPVSDIDVSTNWGAGFRFANRFCRVQGFQTGFPSGEEGRDPNTGQRVVQVWCLK